MQRYLGWLAPVYACAETTIGVLIYLIAYDLSDCFVFCTMDLSWVATAVRLLVPSMCVSRLRGVCLSLDCLRAVLVCHGHQVCFRLTGVDVCSNPGQA